MKCTVTSAIVFVITCILYGASYAFVAKGLKYFSAGLFQTFRMLFGFIFTLCVLAVHCIFKKDYRQIVKSHFTSGWKPIVFLLIDGLLNLGTPHCLIAVAQQWVSSSNVQLMQPFSTAAGAVFAHFVLPDEPFTLHKLWSMLLSLAGVIFCAVPAFVSPESSGATVGQMALGWFLVIISICMFGIATVFYKWKIPNADVTTGVAVQLFASVAWNVIWMLIFDGPSEIKRMVAEAPPIAWLYPVLVGALVSGVAVQGLMWTVGALGSFGSNLIPFGQIIVGVIVGVAFLQEWAAYTWWEILLCIIGMLVLIASLAMGFTEKKPESKNDDDQHNEEEENTAEKRNEEDELPEL